MARKILFMLLIFFTASVAMAADPVQIEMKPLVDFGEIFQALRPHIMQVVMGPLGLMLGVFFTLFIVGHVLQFVDNAWLGWSREKQEYLEQEAALAAREEAIEREIERLEMKAEAKRRFEERNFELERIERESEMESFWKGRNDDLKVLPSEDLNGSSSHAPFHVYFESYGPSVGVPVAYRVPLASDAIASDDASFESSFVISRVRPRFRSVPVPHRYERDGYNADHDIGY